MPRVISLYLPDWPIERLGLHDGPLILAQRRLVYAASAQARALGVTPGMKVAQAQALAPGLAVRDAALRQDRAGLNALALWALAHFSPLVAAAPDGVIIDATGTAHLHGGEAALLQTLSARMAAKNLTARIAMADTIGAAHAFARAFSEPVIRIQPGNGIATLLPLPLGFLRLPPEMVDSLARLGFERIGDIANVPRAPLTQRVGPELFLRLDQAFGRIREPIEPVRPPELIAASRQFAEPIAAPETLARYTGKLAVALCKTLEAKGQGARRLDLIFTRVDRGMQAIAIGTSRPNRDAARLTRLLCDKLETIDPGFGVEAMELRASATEPFETHITSLLDEGRPDISGLVDILANRVGEANVYRIAPVESDVPERSVRRIPAAAPPTHLSWPEFPRPVRLLKHPEPITTLALLPDNPPVRFSWRGVSRKVAHADGPERIFGEWWKRDAETHAVRDYFQVEDEHGERFWIFRKGDGEHPETGENLWFLHGIFA